VRIWSGADCLQTINLPGCVWAVAFTAAGELVAGTSDSNAYIWSQALEKQTDSELLQQFEASMAARTVPKGNAQGAALAQLLAVF
jgi:hypothetical protein